MEGGEWYFSFWLFRPSKVKSISWEKLWRSKRISCKTFHSPHNTFSGFPETRSISWQRFFWPSMHMMCGLEERIKAPASRWATYRQVFILDYKLYFLVSWISLPSVCSIYSALVWTWSRRSWSRRCRPPRPSRTSGPFASWPAWPPSLPPPLLSWPVCRPGGAGAVLQAALSVTQLFI